MHQLSYPATSTVSIIDKGWKLIIVFAKFEVASSLHGT